MRLLAAILLVLFSTVQSTASSRNPVRARKPSFLAPYCKVDIIVINRHRQVA